MGDYNGMPLFSFQGVLQFDGVVHTVIGTRIGATIMAENPAIFLGIVNLNGIQFVLTGTPFHPPNAGAVAGINDDHV